MSYDGFVYYLIFRITNEERTMYLVRSQVTGFKNKRTKDEQSKLPKTPEVTLHNTEEFINDM
jgi:hypothetical protein